MVSKKEAAGIMLANIEEYGVQRKGYAEIKKHLYGENLTQKQAILAKCYDCMGFYSDGAADCKVTTCSLYPFMPFSETGPRKLKKGRVYSEEEKAVISERFKNARLAKK
jgi:hypothetical protein